MCFHERLEAFACERWCMRDTVRYIVVDSARVHIQGGQDPYDALSF